MTGLFGMELPELPEGVTALECVMSIKALDNSGSVRLYERCSQGLTNVGGVGNGHDAGRQPAQQLEPERG